MFEKNVMKQYFATFLVNINTVAYGGTMGWPSPHLLSLQSSNSPIESGSLTIEQASWIGGTMCIGALIGTLLFGWLANEFGRKISMCLLSIPQFLSWMFILFNQNIYYLLVSRFLGGISAGMFVVVPLYVAEISDVNIRGILGSQIILFCNSGILLMFIAGNYLTYFLIPKIMMILPVIYLIGVIFLPETPCYLLKQKKEKEAEKSWNFYHNLKNQSFVNEFKNDLEKLHKNDANVKTNIEWKDFTTPVARKAFIISIGLATLHQLSGCFAILNYTATIFKEAGSDLTPNIAAIIVALIQLLGSYASTIFVDRAGRKVLLLTSSIGICLGLSVMGIYGLLKVNNHNVEQFGWLPIASLSFVLFIASLGVLSLPFVVMSEVMPAKIRATATTICMVILNCCAFITVKYFTILADLLSMQFCMFIFAGICFAGTIFIYFFVPETKGKSFSDIMELLEKR